MKRTSCILLAALMALSILAGCQKTPEVPLAVGKNNEIMLEKAQVGDPQPSDDGTAMVDWYKRLGAPQDYKADLVSKGGKLTVHVDANVELPDTELPIIRVQSAAFSTEQVKTMARALLGDSPRYVAHVETKTRAALEREIQRLRDGIADWDNVGTYLFDMVYDTRTEAQKALDKLLEEAANAPETLPAFTPDFSWEKVSVWTDEGEIATSDTRMALWAMPDDATYSWIGVNNTLGVSGFAELEYCRDFLFTTMGELTRTATDVSERLTLSEQDAYALATRTVQNMGLSDFVCSARQGVVDKSDPAGYYATPLYAFFFTPRHLGVAETYTNANGTSGTEHAPSWRYEQVQVRVDDDGVAYVKYAAPRQTVDAVMSATTLMPFDDIRGVFEKMVVIVGNRADTGALEEQEYVITNVRLGLMSVREENADTGLVIPVWDFLGYENYVTLRESGTSDTNALTSYLTINAIDGSIIQRGNSY